MNLAYIIDKTQYLKIDVESITVDRQGIEMGHVGSVHTFMYYGGPPITKLEFVVENIDRERFYKEADLHRKVVCECRFQGMHDLANTKTHLIEFVPIEITYTPDMDSNDHSKLIVTCFDCNLIILGE